VAGIALWFGVRSEQWEPRQVVVEKHVVLPGVLGMAIETLRSLRSLVRVIVFVTRQAVVQQGGIENRLDMTGLTFERLVSPVQRVARDDLVVKPGIFPEIVAMTGAAIVAEVTVVTVVFAVATHTRDVEFIRKRVFAVTVVTDEFAVPAVECELSVAGVIETGIGPTDRRMAVITFLAAATFMDVVFGVAAVAGSCSVQKCLVFVAAATLDVDMIADQWIVRRVMVEFHVRPSGWRMTIAAFGTECFFVDVVRLMAVIALRLCLPVF